jgi:predicted kinase
MRKLILIAGYLAAGKSTLARNLSDHLRVPCYSKDRLNEIYGTFMAAPSAEERPKLSIASFQILLYAASEALRSGKSVILESNFKPQESAVVQNLAKEYASDVLTLMLTGDMPTLHARFVERQKNRSPIHQTHGLEDYNTFVAVNAQFTAFRAGGEVIAVDTTDFAKVDTPGLYARVERFLQSAPRTTA